MSEYWKSTPKYWCKHCKIFVRDTKLETANHNASPRHQGNLKRFLRDLQRDHERGEKDKDRAKSEVARLNSLVTSARPRAESSSSSARPSQAHNSTTASSISESQRKQHLSQLADMGINIPSELRAEMAMPGEWQVVSERILDPRTEGEKKIDEGSIGGRKRLLEEEEEHLEHKSSTSKWKSTAKSYRMNEDDKELDALLKNLNSQNKTLGVKNETQTEIKKENGVIDHSPSHPEGQPGPSIIKSEPCESDNILLGSFNDGNPEIPSVPSAVFKKRKVKNIRHK